MRRSVLLATFAATLATTLATTFATTFATSTLLSVGLLVAPSVAGAQVAPKTGFRAEYLAALADDEKKLVQLAEATPADKYTWRPGKGVRSISEVYLHVAEDNFVIPAALGVRSPVAMIKNFDTQSTDKSKVIAILKQSLDAARQAALTVKDADLDKEVALYGTKFTQRGALLSMINHIAEHLGQSIAYARMNNIVPPWSAKSGM